MSREPKRFGYDEDKLGLSCPACGCRDFRTRKTERKQDHIYRYKNCRHCGRSVHTNEIIDKERTGVDSQSIPSKDISES